MSDWCPAAPAESASASNSPYRGLILDFGGVLTTPFEGALRSYCARDGLAPDALEKIFTLDQGAQGILIDLERGRISQAEFVAHLAPALGVDPEGLLERMIADLHPEPLMTAAVAELRSRGVKVGVLSNSWGSAPFDPYARFQLDEHYDTVVISDQVGLRKPDQEIFTLMLQRLNLPGEQCVFVDDVARYLPPAQALGMVTIHTTDPATTVTELKRIFGHLSPAAKLRFSDCGLLP
ncbi:MAG: HAD family hydrolase [Pseudonocardiaceae bacterium]